MPSVRVFKSAEELAENLSKEIALDIVASSKISKPFSIALSGGSTPEMLYSELSKKKYARLIPWNFIHLFLGDERCVPYTNSESNFGMVKRTLIDKVKIPGINIHPVPVETGPESAAAIYSEVIRSMLPVRDELPVFDLVLLGLGEDGHTASIFPDRPDLFNSEHVCEAVIHPQTGQSRVTLTCPVLNNAQKVVFLVTGQKKANVLEKILKEKPGSELLPAKFIKPVYGSLEWFLDEDAGRSVGQGKQVSL